jgi:hypothetical protein
MRTFAFPRIAAALIVSLLMRAPGFADVITVPGDYPLIQMAIDNSKNGDVILVSPGVYSENINFSGKAITVAGTNVSDPTVVANTIIHGVGHTSVVTFSSGEDSNSILAGLTITGGYGTLVDDLVTNVYWGGGVFCYLASPTIVGNVIIGNTGPDGSISDAGYGVGIACVQSDATIIRNRITGNGGYAGGGILTYFGNARIVSNLIYSNSATAGGGAVLIEGSEFLNNTVAKNAAEFAAVYIVSDSQGRCVLNGNIIVAATSGGGAFIDAQDTNTQFTFNDVWNNTGGDYLTVPGLFGTNGNISQDPLFVDALNSDYHLHETSSCINAGDPNFQSASGETDFYGGVRVYLNRVDIGAAEYSDDFTPLADAGPNQFYSDPVDPALIHLDGSRSYDPEGSPLAYHWKQVSGWILQLTDPDTASPSFMHPWPGTYIFELVVNDGLKDSKPAQVIVTFGPNHAPIADPGSSIYVTSGNVTLDGSHSYDPDGTETLSYRWRQISGPTFPIKGTNTAQPVVTFSPRSAIQKCVFELVVSDGELSSSPTNVTVTIVPNYGNSALTLSNPPFDPSRPTILAFNGGNCVTGSGMTFQGRWVQDANWITVNSYGPPYARYGDMLMVFLSNIASKYTKPIQTMGFSTGNLPAMEVARYANATYKDARYAINRVSLLDAVCSDLNTSVAQFTAAPVAGEQCWVDNYISNDPAHARQPAIATALNLVCSPPRAHVYPPNRYASSSFDYNNGGLTAFAYVSVIGAGKNYQLKAVPRKYSFLIDSTEAVVFANQALYPGKILAPVLLNGPADGETIPPNGAIFSCGPVENATGYQLLFGTNADRVMDFKVISDSPVPPTQTIATLPQEETWWTIRAYDQFGSTIYADPRLIKSPENRPPVADAGPDLIVYAGLDGMASVTLNAAGSDPDGDALNFTWARSVGGDNLLYTGDSLTLQLPVGVHSVQLMANDGRANSAPDEVTITVVAPLLCKLKVSPSIINARSQGQRILTRIQFPNGYSADDVDDEPLRILPGDIKSVSSWSPNNDPAHASLFAFFNRAAANHFRVGPMELTVVGKFRTGQVFYGQATVEIISNGNGNAKILGLRAIK